MPLEEVVVCFQDTNFTSVDGDGVGFARGFSLPDPTGAESDFNGSFAATSWAMPDVEETEDEYGPAEFDSGELDRMMPLGAGIPSSWGRSLILKPLKKRKTNQNQKKKRKTTKKHKARTTKNPTK